MENVKWMTLPFSDSSMWTFPNANGSFIYSSVSKSKTRQAKQKQWQTVIKSLEKHIWMGYFTNLLNNLRFEHFSFVVVCVNQYETIDNKRKI